MVDGDKTYGLYTGGQTIQKTTRAVWVVLDFAPKATPQVTPQPTATPRPAFTEPAHYPDHSEAPQESPLAPQLYYVTCRALNVRATPSVDLPRLARVARGDALEVLSIENGWAKIVWLGGPEDCAYVAARYLARE